MKNNTNYSENVVTFASPSKHTVSLCSTSTLSNDACEQILVNVKNCLPSQTDIEPTENLNTVNCNADEFKTNSYCCSQCTESTICTGCTECMEDFDQMEVSENEVFNAVNETGVAHPSPHPSTANADKQSESKQPNADCIIDLTTSVESSNLQHVTQNLIAIDSVENQFDNLMLIGGQMAKLGQTKLDQIQCGECISDNGLLGEMLSRAGKEF